MRVHRIHLNSLVEGPVTLTGSEALHLARVLRVQPGQPVVAFDGAGFEASGEVTQVDGLRVGLQLQAPVRAEVEAALPVTVAVALLKGDKLTDVIRQCTELGAVSFRPFISRYADVRELPERRLERLRRVTVEAAKQSGRALVPDVAAAVKLPALIASLRGTRVLFADPQAADSLSGAMAGHAGPLTVLTGPEGGFSDEELAAFDEAGFSGVRFGARVLRAETAPVALLAALLLPEAL